MPLRITPDGISQGFSAAAASYDRAAVAQREIATALSRFLPERLAAEKAVDLGCGTGEFTRLLLDRYPFAEVCAIDLSENMLGECRRKLPEANLRTLLGNAEDSSGFAGVGLVAGNCSAQWFGDFPAAVKGWSCAMAKGGALVFSVPVEGSFRELRESSRAAFGGNLPGLELRPEVFYLDAIARAGLTIRESQVEEFIPLYGSAAEALRSFKKIGAVFNAHDGYSPLTTGKTRRVLTEYDRLFAVSDGGVSLTYRMLLLRAEKK